MAKQVIAPVREWGMGREEEIEYALSRNIPVKQKKDSPYSYDENMWANTGMYVYCVCMYVCM